MEDGCGHIDFSTSRCIVTRKVEGETSPKRKPEGEKSKVEVAETKTRDFTRNFGSKTRKLETLKLRLFASIFRFGDFEISLRRVFAFDFSLRRTRLIASATFRLPVFVFI